MKGEKIEYGSPPIINDFIFLADHSSRRCNHFAEDKNLYYKPKCTIRLDDCLIIGDKGNRNFYDGVEGAPYFIYSLCWSIVGKKNDAFLPTLGIHPNQLAKTPSTCYFDFHYVHFLLSSPLNRIVSNGRLSSVSHRPARLLMCHPSFSLDFWQWRDQALMLDRIGYDLRYRTG